MVTNHSSFVRVRALWTHLFLYVAVLDKKKFSCTWNELFPSDTVVFLCWILVLGTLAEAAVTVHVEDLLILHATEASFFFFFSLYTLCHVLILVLVVHLPGAAVLVVLLLFALVCAGDLSPSPKTQKHKKKNHDQTITCGFQEML